MGRIFLVVGLAGLLLLGGCMQNPYWSRDYGVEALTMSADSAAMKLQQAITKKDGAGIVDAACFNVPTAAGDETKCQQQRNAALAALLVASDDLCQLHLKSIYGNDAYYNILTGSVATLFSGAAAIAGSASAKSALAAISTFSNAERSLINETIYKNMLVTATTKKIRETRDSKAASLLPSSFKKSIDDYPMVLAVRDAVDYHYSCSFMLGLEKALEEGTQSGVEGKMAKLEQEKRTLELYVSARSAALSSGTPAATKTEIAADKGVAGANARIEAVETQLLVLLRSQAATAGTGDKQVDGSPPKADPVTLSKAYYSLMTKLATGKTALSAKLKGATPATAGWNTTLADKLDGKVADVTMALGTQTCETKMNALNAQIDAKQGQVAAAADEGARTLLSDQLNALLVQSGRYAARLTLFEATYTSTTSTLIKAIDDAKQVINESLNGQIDKALNGIVASPALCTL
jgi:hypothetical protein